MTSVFLYVPNLIGYCRIVLAISACFFMQTNPWVTFWCYFWSQMLDAVDGHAARYLGQASKLGAFLDMLTDRASCLVLIMSLGVFYPKWLPIFQLVAALDVVAHWLFMAVAYLNGQISHKTQTSSNPILNLYYSNRVVLFCACAGNELFFMCLYALHFAEGPIILGLGMFRLLAYISFPIAIFKTLTNVLHLGQAACKVVEMDEEVKKE